jgi:hypothetical protein
VTELGSGIGAAALALKSETGAAASRVAGITFFEPESAVVVGLCPCRNENDPALNNSAATNTQLTPERGTNDAN